MFTVGQEAQLRWYESLAEAGVLASKFKDKTKRVDAVKLLQLSGLMVLRDSHKVYGGPGRGVCQKYGLGPNHPLFHRFTAMHGDLRDPLGLPCIVGDDSAVIAA